MQRRSLLAVVILDGELPFDGRTCILAIIRARGQRPLIRSRLDPADVLSVPRRAVRGHEHSAPPVRAARESFWRFADAGTHEQGQVRLSPRVGMPRLPPSRTNDTVTSMFVGVRRKKVASSCP